MNVDTADRIESAWRRINVWVTDNDNAGPETYIIDIQEQALVLGLEAIRSRHASFAFKPLWVDEDGLQPKSVRDLVELLASGQAANVEISCETMEPGFDLSLLLIVDRVGSSQYYVDAIWWTDRVFPDGIDARQRFADMVSNFLALHRMFGSTRLFIGPENCEGTRNPGSPWTEI